MSPAQTIRATIKEVSETVGAASEDERTPDTELPEMLNFIDGAGQINMETQLVQTLLALDTAKEIPAIDALAQHLKLQTVLADASAEAAEAKNRLPKQVADLSALKELVTPFKFIAICEQAHCRLLAVVPAGTREQADFLDAVRNMITNTLSFQAAKVDTIANAQANFRIWRSLMYATMQDMAKYMYEELRRRRMEIQGMLFDNDLLTQPSRVDECVDKLRNWNAKELMKAVKAFQGQDGRGVKHFDTIISTLQSAGITSPGREMAQFACVARRPTSQGPPTLKTYRDLYNEFVSVRQAARLQLSTRSAATIICNGEVSQVAQFERDLRPLKVTLPQAIRDKLAALPR